MKRRKIRYGEHASQFGHLYLPDRSATPGPAPIVVMVHGGSWSTEFGLTIATAVCRDMAERGAVVWNVEYRRLEEGGGYPETGRDVIAALRALDGPVAAELAAAAIAVDPDQVGVVGHSAGGHLATWAVAQLGARTDGHVIATVVPQSAVLDLTVPSARDKPSVRALLGVDYDDAPQRYADASPAHAPVVDALIALIHTVDDQAVPVESSRHYAAAIAERGQAVMLTEVPGDHAAFLDVRSRAHRATLRALGL